MADELAAQAQRNGYLASLVRLHAQIGVDRLLENFLGRFLGDFLDVHAALGAGHQYRPALRTVQQHGHVILTLDLLRRGDEQPVHLLTFLAGLLGHQDVAEHRTGLGFGVLGAIRQMHPALEPVLKRPLAAAAGVDLALHNHARVPFGKQFVDRGICLIQRGGRLAGWHRHIVPPH